MPMRLKMFSDFPVTHRLLKAPTIARGSEKRTIRG